MHATRIKIRAKIKDQQKENNFRYMTSGDGSAFCLFNKKGFFSIGGNEDFIGVAI